MSLNMLIETHGGFDYTGADFAGWARSVGFKDVQATIGGPHQRCHRVQVTALAAARA